MNGKKNQKAAYTPEEFVRIWQTSETFQDVVIATGLTKQSAASRASRYRKMKVKLKRFWGKHRKAEPLDIDALNAIIDQIEKESASDA